MKAAFVNEDHNFLDTCSSSFGVTCRKMVMCGFSSVCGKVLEVFIDGNSAQTQGKLAELQAADIRRADKTALVKPRERRRTNGRGEKDRLFPREATGAWTGGARQDCSTPVGCLC